MTGDVHIFEVYVGEVTSWLWLCGNHLAERARGKSARPPKQLDEPVGFRGNCDDCVRAEQTSSDYVSVTVAFAPTEKESHVPAPGWTPDKMLEPWPARLARLTKDQGKRTENAA